MPKPDAALVVKWRKLAEDGFLYAEIARMYPEYSVDQVRHYCLGHTGRGLPGPIQRVDRWYGSNVWLRGENSPHSELSAKQAKRVLDDWDEETDRWKSSGAEWARRLGVSPSTIYMLRRGETWQHLEHPNQGRKPKKRGKRGRSATGARQAASRKSASGSANRKGAGAAKKKSAAGTKSKSAAGSKRKSAAKRKRTTASSKRKKSGPGAKKKRSSRSKSSKR